MLSVCIGALERFGVLVTSRQRTAAAAGSSQADATLIGAFATTITGASGTNGVVLRNTKNPYTALVYSSAATNALLIYPPVGGTINSGSVNAAFSATARKPVVLYCLSKDGLTWVADLGA